MSSRDWLQQIVLATFIWRGNLRITTPSGATVILGDGTGKLIAVRFTTWAAVWGTLFDPELKLGEAYMDGAFIVESGSIVDVLALISAQYYDSKPRWAWPQWLARYLWRRLQQYNRRDKARKNVAHHYDLDGRLYSLFLDADRQYSCAYFERPGQSLDDAQLAKKRHLAAKLLVSPGHHILDIGSGWGGLALYLTEFCKARVTGITLSDEQLAVASSEADERGLSAQVDFRLQDYRDVVGQFDRIVSVGMFEHVGIGFYDAYFCKCAELLAEDGVFLLHSIGRSEGPAVTNPWIAKYIFPGGYIPALSEVLPAIERAGLLVTDIEILRLHYAETLKAWHERFLAIREQVEQLYDTRFCRMWEFYLACAETSFRCDHQSMMVFEIQLTKRQGVVPITHDYIAREESQLRAFEDSRRSPLRIASE